MYAVEVHNLRKEFNRGPRGRRRRVAALDGVSFAMERGECVAILGQNGSGKSTLIRVLSTLLLLDEPTTGLDPWSKLEVQDFIREIRVSHDSTILLCTHDLGEAEALADRIGILDAGRLLCLAPAGEIKDLHEVGTLEEAFFAATGRTFREERRSDGRRVPA